MKKNENTSITTNTNPIWFGTERGQKTAIKQNTGEEKTAKNIFIFIWNKLRVYMKIKKKEMKRERELINYLQLLKIVVVVSIGCCNFDRFKINCQFPHIRLPPLTPLPLFHCFNSFWFERIFTVWPCENYRFISDFGNFTCFDCRFLLRIVHYWPMELCEW